MNPDFMKSFAASLLLHSVLFISISQQPDSSASIEVEIKTQAHSSNGPDNKQDKIKDKVDEGPKGDIKRNEAGFWGIGVAMTLYPNAITDRQGNSYPGLLVTDVYPNYPAQLHGLQVNDVIYKVDGKVPNGTNEDLRSDGPKPITLDIIRYNQTLTLTFNRDWIRIEGQ